MITTHSADCLLTEIRKGQAPEPVTGKRASESLCIKRLKVSASRADPPACSNAGIDRRNRRVQKRRVQLVKRRQRTRELVDVQRHLTKFRSRGDPVQWNRSVDLILRQYHICEVAPRGW